LFEHVLPRIDASTALPATAPDVGSSHTRAPRRQGIARRRNNAANESLHPIANPPLEERQLSATLTARMSVTPPVSHRRRPTRPRHAVGGRAPFHVKHTSSALRVHVEARAPARRCSLVSRWNPQPQMSSLCGAPPRTGISPSEGRPFPDTPSSRAFPTRREADQMRVDCRGTRGLRAANRCFT